MGFLDLFKGKKKEESKVPPPAPGPNNKNVSGNQAGNNPNPKQAGNNPKDSKNNTPQAPPKPNLDNKLPSFGGNQTNNNNSSATGQSPQAPGTQQPNTNISDLKVPKPPSAMGPEPTGTDQSGGSNQKGTSDKNPQGQQQGVNPTPKENMDHNYDFSLPEMNLPNQKGPQQQARPNQTQANNQQEFPQGQSPDNKQTPDEDYTDNQWNREKVELRSRKDVDRYTDNEDFGLVEKRLQVHRKAGGPIFIEVTDYKHVLDGVDYMKAKMKESGDYVFKIEEYNEEKEKQFEQWKSSLEDVQRKLAFVQKTLFGKTR